MLTKLMAYYTVLWAGFNVGAVIASILTGQWLWALFYGAALPFWLRSAYRQGKRVGWIK